MNAGSRTAVRIGLPALAAIVLLAMPVLSGNLYTQNLLITTFLLAIGATGWNIMGGYAGYISLGNSAFVGLGAYTTGILAVHLGLSPFVGCLLGGAAGAVYAVLLSVVTWRTRGMFFTIVTFAALMLLQILGTILTPLTGGSSGLALPLPTWDLSLGSWPIYYPMLFLLALAVAASALVRRSKLGLGLFAIRDDEDKAAGLGVRTARYKLIAFVVGGTFLGIAGGLFAYNVSFLNTAAVFDIDTSMLILLSALLGGRGTLWGPVLGAFIIEPLANLTSTDLLGADSGVLRLALFGGLLGAVVLFLPRGIIPTARAIIQRRRGAGPIAAGGSRDANAADDGARTDSGPTGLAAGLGAARPAAVGDIVLEASGLAKRFGALRAVDDVTITLRAGRATGLIGPNGSGKTTLFNLLDGTIPTRDGTIVLGGTRISGRTRATRAQAGLARTYQLPRLFPGLTVLENVVVAQRSFSLRGVLSRRVTAEERDRASALLAHVGLASYAEASPGDLSYGQRKLIELIQVLWLDPLVVMLDEPAAGISPALMERLRRIVDELHERGVAVLLVEHDLPFLSDICSDVYVMAEGRIIAEGAPEQIKSDATVVDAYLGDRDAVSTRRGA
ncbi:MULTISPECIES: ATP-binding cassette domain-containing protein [unclassified Microbacterium]|uniref:branched-chain amino acid ABC transporter ATP-binding protein/permease n=1 Tax=unclassified Microbacterium TaxID=2609290 RepID=UPI00365CA441